LLSFLLPFTWGRHRRANGQVDRAVHLPACDGLNRLLW
jgi:hypothetical protein